MKISLLRLPGNGERQLDFPGVSTITLDKVLAGAQTQIGVDVTMNTEIAVNGETVPKSGWSSRVVYAGDLVSATGVVKGAIWAALY